MAVGDGDLDVFFQDGDAGTLSDGSVVMGHFEIPEQIDTFGAAHPMAGVMAGKPTFTYSTAAGAAIVDGTAIAVKGVSYVVRTTKKQGDGQVSVAELKAS